MGRSAALLSGVVLLSACGAGTGAHGPEDDTGGMGVPQQFSSEEFPGQRRAVEARVHVASNGCFLGSLADGGRDRYLVVWPRDTEQGASGNELRLPDGATVEDGDLLAGDGTLMRTRALEGFGRGSYWDTAVGFCTPGARHVLVLDRAVGR